MTQRDPADTRSGFERTFGVSEQELQSRGIDRHEYVRKTLDGWITDPALRANHLPGYPQSELLRRRLFRRLNQGWMVIFVSFVPLLVFALTKHDHVIHLVAAAAAIAGALVTVAMIALTLRDHRRYVGACRSEDISPSAWW